MGTSPVPLHCGQSVFAGCSACTPGVVPDSSNVLSWILGHTAFYGVTRVTSVGRLGFLGIVFRPSHRYQPS